MNSRSLAALPLILLGSALLSAPADEPEQKKKQPDKKQPDKKQPFGKGKGGFGGFGGMMGGAKIKLVKKFDKDGDGRLNKEERKAAREYLKKERAGGRGGFRPGGKGPGGVRPGGFLAKPLLEAPDADADDKG